MISLLISRNFLFTTLLSAMVISLFGQGKPTSTWNGHACAVVLTYDDGLNVHLDNVIPSLDSAGFKGTFYIPANAGTLDKRGDEWRRAAANGHELGNHTLFHPCNGKSKQREWVSPDHDLDDYTMGQLLDEIRLANVMLKAVDGKDKRTFAYTCGDNVAGGEILNDLIHGDFTGARAVSNKMDTADDIDLFNINAYMIDDTYTAGDLIVLVKEAKKNNSLLVFIFHGVGGEHGINIALEKHKALVDFLKENNETIWVAPLVDVSTYLAY